MRSDYSVEDATLVGWDHVLDIDESVLTSVGLEKLKSLLNKVSQILSLSLSVVDLVSQVLVTCLEQVHHWENLSVVWHEGFANGVRANDEGLQDFEGDGDDL